MPDWKDAPEWAQWLAMEAGGGWYWFENEPELLCYGRFPAGRAEYAGFTQTTTFARPAT